MLCFIDLLHNTRVILFIISTLIFIDISSSTHYICRCNADCFVVIVRPVFATCDRAAEVSETGYSPRAVAFGPSKKDQKW
jgi:hypothetical protein